MIRYDDVFKDAKTNPIKSAMNMHAKTLSSNDILVEDGRMSRSKRKTNLKTLFSSEAPNNDRQSMNNTRKQLKAQSSVERDKSEELEIFSSKDTCANIANKSESMKKHASKSTPLASGDNRRNVSKSFNNLFSGVRTWFRSTTTTTTTSVDHIDTTATMSSSLFSKSMCTSSGRKKKRTSYNKEKNVETDRSLSSSKYSEHESRSSSMKRKSDRKRDSKLRVYIYIFF